MSKAITSLFLLLLTISAYSQTEKYPVFQECESVEIAAVDACFKEQAKSKVIEAFEIPQVILQENFRGVVNIVFLVSTSGKFEVIYVNSPYKELKTAVEKAFETLPVITPAKFNNHPVEMQFVFPLWIPLEENIQEEIVKKEIRPEIVKVKEDRVKPHSKSTLFPEHHSELNIPFTHAEYNVMNYYIDQGENSHTAVKPYSYNEIKSYVDLDAQKNKLIKPKSTWFGRKLLNEHMGFVSGKNFWFTIDPGADLHVGKDSEGIKTYNNTRAIHINGGLGKKFNFSTSFYESQGRFADYFNDYAESIRPAGGNPALIPGRGIGKEYKTDSYDYPVAEAYISYTPNKHLNFQFGNGKNFIGDGYRSLFLSDAASPYTYFKINTNFWKIKYTNIWMALQDVRPQLTEDGAYKQKFMAIHYLSWNVTKKLNIGLFETVIWDNANDRGFDINYLNPLIFYTAVEFSTGSRAGNTLLGLSAKYKLKNISFYAQLVIDEMRISEITSNEGWWGNKNGIQIGAKYYNAFNIKNLYLQGEYNAVRPFTYSHDELNYNFGHNNQPMAHLWGANFREIIGIAQYKRDRWYANAKILLGKKGFDFLTSTDSDSYGGEIFRDNDDRSSEYGNTLGQGNKADIFMADLQLGYLLNPATNLKLYGSLRYRNFDSMAPTNAFQKSNSTWISMGLKTDVFNWYFDF